MKLKIKNLFIYIFVLMYILTSSISYSPTVFAEPDENEVQADDNSDSEADDDEDSDSNESESEDETDEADSETADATTESDSLWPVGPKIKGKTAIVIDAESGAILYEKKKDKQMYPASITKILTCLLTLENCDMKDNVTMSHFAVYNLRYGDAHIGLKEGETISVEDCLYALMLASANEVAYGLSEHIGGSVEGFADMMNNKAKEVGALNSHFVNPNGLPDENHYTTAYDMAMITKAALKYDQFSQIVGTKMHVIGKTKMTNEKRYTNNFHRMLYEDNKEYYKGIIGGKTGYTEESGNTLVTIAERDGRKLICVVLKSKKIYEDTKDLLDFGFEKFKSVTIDESTITSPTGMCYNKLAQALGKGVMTVSYPNGNYLTVPANADENDITYEISLKDANTQDTTQSTTTKETASTTKPTEKAKTPSAPPVATVTYYYDNKEVGSIDISYKVTATPKEDDDNEGGFFKNITKKKTVSFFSSSIMKALRLLGLILGITILILIILALRIAHINKVNRKRKEERRRKRLEIRERERREQEEAYRLEREHRTNRDNHMK